MGFFHNSEVGREVCVKHLIKAESAKSGNHFALNVCADFITELFAERRTDCRSGLNNNEFIGVVDSGKNLVCVVLLIKCAGGAVDYALTAGDT